MARRKRARRHVARRTVRRRRRVTVSATINSPRRRRRHVATSRRRRALSNPPRRRRRHRNPPNVRGIAGGVVRDLKNGLGVYGGLVATRKIRGAITGMLPASAQATVQGTAGKIGLSLASAIVASVIARRILPRFAPFIAAGAFAEVVDCAVQATPVGAYLSAYPRFRAYPGTLPVPTNASIVAGGARALPAARTLRAYPLPRHVGATA